MTLSTQTHTFELLTPAWTGGATPEARDGAEIRVPTLRGHLRQWLRLLYRDQHLDEAIFGSVAEGGTARASKVQLRLQAPVVSTEAHDLDSYTQRGLEVEGYFLWPLRPPKKRAVIFPKPSTQFTLETRWYPAPATPKDREDREKALQQALTAFSILGTIGTRATRGYGSVWDTSHSFPNESALSAALTFLPTTITVRLLDGSFDDGRKALASAARWMRSLRVGSDTYGTATTEGRNDHNVADPAQAAQRNAVVYRQALGMPLTQRYKRGKDERGKDKIIQVKSSYFSNGQDNDRYPSPVRIKVIKLGGKFRVLIVVLKGLLLDAGTQISLRGGGGNRTATLSHQLIDLIAQAGTAIH